MDASAECASSTVRALHAEVKAAHVSGQVPSTDQLGKWRKAAATVAKVCIAQERRIAAERHIHEVETTIMLEEMRGELVTREANAARTAERFRLLSGRVGNGSDCSAYDRAVQTAESVDATIRALCANPVSPGIQGTELLRSDLES